MAASAPAPEKRSGGGNLLTQRLGPLATWVWLLIATLLIGAYYLYEKHKQGTTAATATTATGATANASGVPDIILQDYGSPVTQTVTGPPAGSAPPSQPAPAPATQAAGTPPAAKPKAAAPKPAPPSQPIFNSWHTVQKGETLASIARDLHITREQLAHANGFGTGAGLRTGQVLRVPSPAPGGKPNKAP
jgi:LysM repeat protein